jgi:hypothetical protein
VLTLFFSVANAQEEKNVYEDSTIIKSEAESQTVLPLQAPDEEISTDTSLDFNQLKISPDSVNNWKELRAFAYAKYLDSLLKAKQDEKVQVQSQPTGPNWFESLLSSSGMRAFFWILAIAFILFILYRLFLAQGVFRRSVSNDNTQQPAVTEEAITNDSDFDALIRQAKAAGNYRLAVRYHYLQTLHRLAAKNYLSLAADKTNYQYVSEISNLQYRNEFASLTLSYEYVWYGEFAIEENIYRKIESGFSGFNAKT